MTIQRIRTARANYDIETFVAKSGEIFYSDDGILRFGDGQTPGGRLFLGAGNNNGNLLTISEINSNNLITNIVNNVSTVRFDKDTGFNVEDLGNGEVKISLGSTFKTWKVDGQEDLVAVGEDVIRFEAGPGITITTDPNSAVKTIKIEYSGEIVDAELPTASTLIKGGVIVGDNLSVESNGLLTVKSNKVVEEVVKAPVLVEVPEDNQALMYKNGKWTNSPSMFWSSKNW
jgi:hypothetical protein